MSVVIEEGINVALFGIFFSRKYYIINTYWIILEVDVLITINFPLILHICFICISVTRLFFIEINLSYRLSYHYSIIKIACITRWYRQVGLFSLFALISLYGRYFVNVI